MDRETEPLIEACDGDELEDDLIALAGIWDLNEEILAASFGAALWLDAGGQERGPARRKMCAAPSPLT